MMTPAQKQKYPTKMEYVRDRPAFLEAAKKAYKRDKDIVKCLFISLGNGGGVQAWRKENDIPHTVQDPVCIQKLAKECPQYIHETALAHADKLSIVKSWDKENPERTLHFYLWTSFEFAEILKVWNVAKPVLVGYAYDGVECLPFASQEKLQAATVLPLACKAHPRYFKEAIKQLTARYQQVDWVQESRINWSDLTEARRCIQQDEAAAREAALTAKKGSKVIAHIPNNHRDFAVIVASRLEQDVISVGDEDKEKVKLYVFHKAGSIWKGVHQKYLHNTVAEILKVEFAPKKYISKDGVWKASRCRNYLKSRPFIDTILAECISILMKPDAPDFDGEHTRKLLMWKCGTCFDTEKGCVMPVSRSAFVTKCVPWPFKDAVVC
jgi:hypothetical protein